MDGCRLPCPGDQDALLAVGEQILRHGSNKAVCRRPTRLSTGNPLDVVVNRTSQDSNVLA